MSASCMCAVCWDRPFCYSSVLQEAAELGDPRCDEDGFDDAQEAVRHVPPLGLLGGFWCLAPGEDKDLSSDIPGCVADTTERARLENYNPCEQLPVECRTENIAGTTCDGAEPPGDPGCASIVQGARRFACGDNSLGEGVTLGRVAAVASCEAIHGLGALTADAPEYMCYATCTRSENLDCDPTFDILGSTDDELSLDVDPSTSLASLAVFLGDEVFSGNVPVDGEIRVRAPARCFGPLGDGEVESCNAQLPRLRLSSSGSFDVDGTAVSNMRVLNPAIVPDDMSTIGSTSIIAFDGTELYATADIEGEGRSQNTVTSPQGITMAIDWAERDAHLLATMADSGGTSRMTLLLEADIPNLPPRANAGPDQSIECGSPAGTIAHLAAAGTTDADGQDDLAAFQWSGDVDGSLAVHSGSEFSPLLPLGTHAFVLTARDQAGAAGRDGVHVTVEDTTGPTIESAMLEPSCLWAPNHSVHLFRLGQELQVAATDICGGLSALRVKSVVSNQPEDGLGDGHTEPDVAFGDGAFCVRAERSGNMRTPRAYTVTIEAVDLAGNVTEATLVLTVPHDQRFDTRCMDAAPTEEVAITDPACQAAAPPPPGAAASAKPGLSVKSPRPSMPHGPSAVSASDGCSLTGGVGAGSSSWTLLGLAAVLGAAARRRRRRSARLGTVAGIALPLLLCLGTTGCSSSGSASSGDPGGQSVDQQDLDAVAQCAEGVWLLNEIPCVCFEEDNALNSPECDAPDCVQPGVMVLAKDGRSMSFNARVSESRGVFSVIGNVGLDAGVSKGTWRITPDGKLVQDLGQSTYETPVHCSGDKLERTQTYRRAELGFAEAVMTASQQESWSSVSFDGGL